MCPTFNKRKVVICVNVWTPIIYTLGHNNNVDQCQCSTSICNKITPENLPSDWKYILKIECVLTQAFLSFWAKEKIFTYYYFYWLVYFTNKSFTALRTLNWVLFFTTLRKVALHPNHHHSSTDVTLSLNHYCRMNSR